MRKHAHMLWGSKGRAVEEGTLRGKADVKRGEKRRGNEEKGRERERGNEETQSNSWGGDTIKGRAWGRQERGMGLGGKIKTKQKKVK